MESNKHKTNGVLSFQDYVDLLTLLYVTLLKTYKILKLQNIFHPYQFYFNWNVLDINP